MNDDEVKAQELDIEGYVITMLYVVEGNCSKSFEGSHWLLVYKGEFLPAFVGVKRYQIYQCLFEKFHVVQ